MLLDYYKLIEQPFGVTPDSRFLYLGPKHREALASLVYGTESNRGFLALIAKPGMGKTSLLYHYLSCLQNKARTAFVFRTDCDSREFIRHLLLDLGIDVAGMDLPAMHDTLNRLLTEEMRAGRRFVLVIDEAQNLGARVLESIRLLSNFETPSMKLMQIVLAGQPQLADRLASPAMAQLRQRISMVIRIEPFRHEDVNAYIDHRLWVAGCDQPSLFTVGARKLITEHSEGIPRNINNLCFNAMSLACALKRQTIDRDVVLDVIADLDLEPLRETKVVAEESKEESKERLPIFSSVAKKESVFGGWIPRLAIISALLLALSWFVVQVGRGEPRKQASPASVAAEAAAPISASLDSTVPGEPASLKTEQAPEAFRVMPGQTLYRISVEKLGKYNGKVLEELRGLNPWLSDPAYIQAGQKLRLPSATTVSTDAQRTAEQAPGAAPAEARKR
jgi:type II secretory pathway predicted ATPase ExeA/LysM repeat protein